MNNQLELTLVRFIPFLTNGVEEFIYTPTKPIQLILGSNGCGKSQLFRQLSYLPGESSDFLKGGKKIIRDGTYELISDFAKGGSGEHYFIKDGIELNPGHTLTVQKNLVETTFGITKEIHSLLIGAAGSLFTQMSVARRKEWLMKLSPYDFDYVIDIHQKVNTELRDRSGAIKHVSGKLSGLTSGESNDEKQTLEFVRCEVARLEKLLKDYRGFKDTMLQKIPRISTKTTLSKESILEGIGKTSDQMLALLKSHRSLVLGIDFDNPTEYVTSRHVLISSLQNEIDVINSKLDKYQNFIELKKEQPDESTVNDLQNTLSVLLNQVDKEMALLNPFKIEKDYNDIRSRIVSSCTNVQYKDSYTEENQNALRGSIDSLERSISDDLFVQNKLSFRLNRLKKAKAVSCTKCGYVDCEEHSTEEALEKEIDALSVVISDKKKSIVDIKESLSEIDIWKAHLRLIRAVKSEYAYLDNFIWKDFFGLGIYKDSLGVIRDYFDSIIPSIEKLKLYYQESVRMKKLTENAELLGDLKSLSLADAEQQIELLSSKRISLLDQIAYATKQLGFTNKIVSLMAANDSSLKDLISSLYMAMEDIVRTESDEAIERAEKAIAFQYKRLTELEGRKALIAELTESLSELKSELSGYQMLSEALNPNTGLIAKLLTSSLHGIISNVNNIIETIWAKSLRVLPCGIEDGKLDYKFKLEVNNYPVLVPDFSMASDGQQDIVNFAFRLMAYKALKLKDYPLFLDEFGKTFDEQHRFNLTEYIKMLVTAGDNPYVFFISHYYGQHGGLTNNETLVLDEANVTVPMEYNTNVIMR